MSATDQKRGKLPLLKVAGVHVFVVLVLWLTGYVHACRQPATEHLKVRLAAAPTAAPSPAPTAAPSTPQTTPDPPSPQPQPQPQPPQPTAPPPKPQAAPENTWKPRSASDIRQRYAKQLSQPRTQPQQSTRPRPTNANLPDSADVASRLSNSVSNQRPQAAGGNETPPQDYFDQIVATLHASWRPPTAAAAPAGVATRVALTIDRSGNLLAGSVIGPSGNGAMDNSIRNLLASGLRFPPFPPTVRSSTLQVRVTLRLQH